jgi:hypothetical protein
LNQTPSDLVALGACPDLEIRILALQDEGYPVEITFSGEQEFPRGYLKANVMPWVPTTSPTYDGERLFELLFSAEELRAAWAKVCGQSPRRRIRLRIDDSAPELHTIPWELLRDASPGVVPRTLAADTDTPFSRYLASERRPGGPILKRPIKLLVAIANPENLARYNLAGLDVETEKDIIAGAITGLDAGQINLTFLEPPVTLPALEAELRQGYHALHIVAHGRAGEGQAAPVLFLADEENQVTRVTDAELAEMIKRLGVSLRLVFLGSCQTATRSAADAFRGFAPRLTAAGVPAVLAMQDAVPVSTARRFAGVFYRRLLEHGHADLAGNEARATLLTARLPGAAIPVLYMRLRSGKLFDQRGQVLGERAESFWSVLLDNVAAGECTPFLGSGVTREILPSHAELAQALAQAHNYPFADCDRLPCVAQFVGTFDNRHLRREVLRNLVTGFKKRMGLRPDPADWRTGLSKTAEKANWSELSQQLTESEIHHQLADLRLPLYVTTNFDNFMTLALRAKEQSPRRETIAWREPPQKEAGSPHYDLSPPVDRHVPPVVLHLFGTDDKPLSMVLTQDDYLDYLARISRDYQYLIPTSVNARLASTTLLFLGYRLEDIDLKVIMRGLLANVDLRRWSMLHVAVQIETSEVDEAKHREVIRYFQKYFGNSQIDVYWGSAHQFVADLHARWQEYLNG